MRILILAALPLMLGGCVRTVVGTAWDAATLPVHVAGKGVDLLTTSQAEADRNRGRMMRKEAARQRKEDRKEARERRREQRDEAHDARGG